MCAKTRPLSILCDSAGVADRIEQAAVLVCQCSDLSAGRRGGRVWAAVQLKGAADSDLAYQPEVAAVQSGCDQILKVGATVVIAHGGMSAHAKQTLIAAGILCVENAGFDGCRLAADATGGMVVRELAHLDKSSLGSAECVQEVNIEDESMVEISGCSALRRCSMLLRAPTHDLLHECGRSLYDALCVACVVRDEGKLVPAAGAVELRVAYKLRQQATTVRTAEQHSLNIFADALEVIPATVVC